MSLLDEEDTDFSDEWIEDPKMKADLCISKVQEYLDERAHKPLSDISSLFQLAQLWINKWISEFKGEIIVYHRL